MPKYREIKAKPTLTQVVINPDGSLLAFYDDAHEPGLGISPKCRVSVSSQETHIMALANLLIEQHQEIQVLKAQVAALTQGKDDGK